MIRKLHMVALLLVLPSLTAPAAFARELMSRHQPMMKAKAAVVPGITQ